MARIDTGANNQAPANNGADKVNSTKPTKTIEELKTELDQTVNSIREVFNGEKDRNKLTDDQKRRVRPLYNNASRIARLLSKRLTDVSEVEKYESLAKKFASQASLFGSVMKFEIPKTTFDDVKGLEDVKKVVKSFLFMAQNPHVLDYYHIKGGLGMMMYGAPGTGKTMFAEAIANAMQLPLLVVTPADIFKSYVGESEKAVKEIFDEMDSCPDGAVLFVDECESIFSKRGADTKDYKAAVTNELLQRMNGMGEGDKNAKRVLIAATNRPDVIDPAYLRYKRFTHLIHVSPPDLAAKSAIIHAKLKGIELASDITVDDVVNMTEEYTNGPSEFGLGTTKVAYYSSADLCGIIEEACRCALEVMENNQSSTPIPLNRSFFEKAFNKIKPSISADTLKWYEEFAANRNKNN